MIYASSPTRKHDAILKIIEMNLKEETDLGGVFQDTNNARGVADASVSPQERKTGAICITSLGEHAAPNNHVSPRKLMAGRRATSSTALASPGTQAASNNHVSPRKLMAGRRAASSTALVPPGRQAAPTSHASLRRSMAGRRAASSTALGAGSKGRHTLFRRQFSLRGWRENDSGHDGIPEEIPEAKRNRLHDYTESPIGVRKSPFN
jgi:hypothetical protein